MKVRRISDSPEIEQEIVGHNRGKEWKVFTFKEVEEVRLESFTSLYQTVGFSGLKRRT